MGVRKIDTETPPSPAPTAIPEPASPAAAAVPDSPGHYTVTVDGAVHAAYVDGDRVEIDGRAFTVGVGAAEEGASPPPPSPAASMPASVAPAAGVPVEANMPGKVLRIEAGPGTTVHDGDAVIILEAMKMEVTVPSPVTGEVAQVLVSVGDQVATGAQLATVVPA